MLFSISCTPSSEVPDKIVISDVSPTSGDPEGGFTISISGSGFTFIESVEVNDLPCTRPAISTEFITCTAPAVSGPGTYSLVVKGKANRSARSTFTYDFNTITLTSFTPVIAPLAGGTPIFLTGSGFTSNTQVTIGGSPCDNINILNSSLLECYVPARAIGSYNVVVSNTNNSLSATAPDPLTYNPFPVITSVSPSVGSTIGGTTLTISGSNFFSGLKVDVGSVRCSTVTVVSSSQVTCVTNSGTAGTYDVRVSNADSQSASLPSAFTYFSPPAATNVSPLAGPLGGGNTLTIIGRNFSSSTSVLLGTAPCTPVTFVNTTRLTCPAPTTLPAGTHVVSVTNPGTTTGTLTPGYTYQDAPFITAITPPAGPLAGGTEITLTGTNFRTGVGVDIIQGAITKTCTIQGTPSSTQIRCHVPSFAAGSANIRVTNTDNQSSTYPSGYIYQEAPSISSVSPIAVPLAGGTITINGSNFLPGAVVRIDGTIACPITVLSSTALTCLAGTHPEAGVYNVEVENADGQIATANLALNYLPAPGLSGVTPSAGAMAGNTTITLGGSGFFATGISVTVGGNPCTDINVLNTNTLTCRTPGAPGGLPGASDIVVTNVDGQSGTGTTYTYQLAPVVSSVTPANGRITGGILITITGSNFLTNATVDLGGSSCNVQSLTPTQITCVTGAHAAGVVNVRVINPDAQQGNLNSGFTYDPPPGIASINPVAVPTTTPTSIVITGINYVSGVTVEIGSNTCAVTATSATTITCTTVADTAGAKQVKVTNPDGQEDTFDSLDFLEAVEVTSLSPSAGPLAGGNTLTINGNNFVNGSVVTVGAAPCTTQTFVSATQINCVLPSGTGATTITVTNPDTQSDSATYTFQAAPLVTSISPTNGVLAGGTVVTVNGSGFLAGVTAGLGGASCTVNPATVTSNSFQCTTSARSAGTVALTVTNTDGQAQTYSNIYTYDPAPIVTSITPTLGSTSGGTRVTITGSHFGGAPVITVGALPCVAVSTTSTSITCDTSSGASGAATVSIQNTDGQTGTLPSGFTYIGAPTVAGVSPVGGPPTGGTLITITGTNFTSNSSVTVGGQTCTSVTFVSSTTLRCVSPAGTAGSSVNVVITTIDSMSGALNSGFTYSFGPQVSYATPTYGPIGGGTSVTVVGVNFVSGARVFFGTGEGVSCVYNSANSITCQAPVSLLSGYVSVTVTNPDTQSHSIASGFYYMAVPTLTSVTPDNGPLSGGTLVMLTGSGFFPGASVTVGGATCSSVTVNSSTSATCVLPSNQTEGDKNIVLTNIDGQNVTLTAGYTFLPAPTVSAISPSNGYFDGGTTVTITGTNFRTGATVRIGLITCSSPVINPAGTSLTCVTGAGSNGTYNVTVTNSDTQSGSLTNGFTYRSPVTLTNVSPSAGNTSGGNTVTIFGTGFISADVVRIGGTLCTSQSYVSTSQILCIMPARSAGTYNVTVTAGGNTITRTDAYTYRAAPVVSSISPTSGSVNGNTEVTITGTGFLAGATVTFGGPSRLCTSVVISATSITCRTPSNTAGFVNVTVTNTDAQTGSLVNGFEYLSEPSLSFLVGNESPTPPNPDDYGSTNTNVTHTFTIRNLGDAPSSTITVTVEGANPSAWAKGTDNCHGLSLGAGQNCTIQMTFLGGFLLPGSYSATLRATAVSGGTITNTVQGTVP